MSSERPAPTEITAAFARADEALRAQLVQELEHDRFTISTGVWSPLVAPVDAREPVEPDPCIGALVKALVAPVGGRVELALQPSAAASLDAWLTRRAVPPAAPPASSFAMFLVETSRTPMVESLVPSEAVLALAGRLMDRWIAALEPAIVPSAEPPRWNPCAFELPRDGTFGARATSFDARLAQLLSEPLGTLFFAAPASFRMK